MADTKRIQVTLSERLLDNIDRLCSEWGISRGTYIEYVLGQNVNTQIRMLENGLNSVLGTEYTFDEDMPE